jgi:hypothetical protein
MGKDFKGLVFDRDGLPEDVRQEAEVFDRELLRALKRCGAKEDPFSLLYAYSFSTAFLVIRHIEGMLFDLWTTAPREGELDSKKDREAALTEAVGKAHERGRKALKDLQDYLEKIGSPTDIALADVMRPVLKKADGVLEDALEFEARKQRRKRGPSDHPESES